MMEFNKNTLVSLSVKEMEKVSNLKERLSYLGDKTIDLNLNTIRGPIVELEIMIKTIMHIHYYITVNYSEDEVIKIESIVKSIFKDEDGLIYTLLFN